MNLTQIKDKVYDLKSKRDYLASELVKVIPALVDAEAHLNHLEQAQIIFQTADKVIKEDIQTKSAELASVALYDVFGDKYKLELEFRNRGKKNKTSEVHIFVIDNATGNKLSPIDDCAGGEIMLISFSLRVSLWALQQDKLRPILILDEPFSALKDDKDNTSYIELAGRMIDSISKELGLQIILISHEDGFKENCDNLIEL